MQVNTEAAGAAIPKWNNVAPEINVHKKNPTGILIAKAEKILFAAAKIVRPQPKKNPLKQNTNGTNK